MTRKKTKPPRVVLGVSVPAPLAEQLRKKARAEDRSVSRTIKRILEAALNGK